MLIAYRARDIAEAHIVSGMLQAEGIEAHVGGHYLQGGLGEIGAAGFTNVHVEDDDYPKARDLIADYEASPMENPPTPSSGGNRVERYAVGFLLVLAVLVAVFVGAL